MNCIIENKIKSLIKTEEIEDRLVVSIETRQCLIRSYSSQDFEKCVALYGNPQNTKYFDHGNPWTKEEVEKLILQRAETFQRNKVPLGLFSIFDKPTGNFIGQCDLFPTSEAGVLEVGCILHTSYQRRGVGMEVVKALVHDFVHFLEEKNFTYSGGQVIKQIIATAHPNNISSNKIVKNLGMTYLKKEQRFGQPRSWFVIDVSKKRVEKRQEEFKIDSSENFR